uniref:Uncharacterized protein n=1 Tax=Romanomermis culicivorax TaxID=13658 RepID=A0A915KEB3_ROMCU
ILIEPGVPKSRFLYKRFYFSVIVKVVKFFNDATSKEMISIPKCSDRIAEALIENRPYKNYDHLLESIKQAKIKGLTSNLVESYIQQLKCRNELDLLLYTCQEISGDLLTCVQKLTIDIDKNSKMVSAPKLLQKE